MSERKKKRVDVEIRRIERERQLRRRVWTVSGVLIAILALILGVLTFLNRRQTADFPNDEVVSSAENAFGADTLTVNTASVPTSTTSVPMSVAETTESTALSMAETVESEVESAAENVSWEAIPMDQQERHETDMDVDWRLILVNPSHKLPDGYYVETTTIPFTGDSAFQFDVRAVDYLEEMLEDCQAAGYSPVLRAGTRTWNTQEWLYEEKVQEWIDEEGYTRAEAEETAATIVAYPGTSEHQLGLAVDIQAAGYDTLNRYQADAPTQQWLMSHCQDYGFILRFPDGKQDLTGIIYEPWHYRYVGKEVAQEIMSRGICLEEYLAENGIGN